MTISSKSTCLTKSTLCVLITKMAGRNIFTSTISYIWWVNGWLRDCMSEWGGVCVNGAGGGGEYIGWWVMEKKRESRNSSLCFKDRARQGKSKGKR